MDLGGRFGEFILIFFLILVFFGSKEIPKYMREAAKFIAKVRSYTNTIRREMDTMATSVTSTVTEALPAAGGVPGQAPVKPSREFEPKRMMREKYTAVRKALTPEERKEKSEKIGRYLLDSTETAAAGAILIYVNMGAEVETREVIRELLRKGKRIVVPYCKRGMNVMGIGEILDVDRDIVIGDFKCPEPRPEARDQFYRSDLKLIVCPGVAFDRFGTRLGRGKGYFDNFLRELKGQVPIMGLAFDCQVQAEPLPFAYTDIMVDQVISESGLLLKRDQNGNLSTPASIVAAPESTVAAPESIVGTPGTVSG